MGLLHVLNTCLMLFQVVLCQSYWLIAQLAKSIIVKHTISFQPIESQVEAFMIVSMVSKKFLFLTEPYA